MTARGIEIAAFCGVAKDGEMRRSQAGNNFALITLIADSGNQDDQGRDVPAFLKCIAFGDAANVAANLKKGQRAYLEGQLSVGIWKPPDGPPRLDLSVKCSKLEPTQIGKNRPRREKPDARPDPQAPLDRRQPNETFDPVRGGP